MYTVDKKLKNYKEKKAKKRINCLFNKKNESANEYNRREREKETLCVGGCAVFVLE
jgi:hypothetical protein